jgi:hypothetical protein
MVTWLGGAAYLTWVLQWLWVCLLYMEQFFQTPVGKLIKPDAAPAQSIAPSTPFTGGFELPMPVLVALAVIGGVALITAAMYAIFKAYIPDVQRVARTAIQKTATVSTKQAIKHHVVPPKKQRTVTARVAFWLKIAVSLLPLAVVFAAQASTPFISREVAKAGALILAILAFFFVLLQHGLMRHWRINEITEQK